MGTKKIIKNALGVVWECTREHAWKQNWECNWLTHWECIGNANGNSNENILRTHMRPKPSVLVTQLWGQTPPWKLGTNFSGSSTIFTHVWQHWCCNENEVAASKGGVVIWYSSFPCNFTYIWFIMVEPTGPMDKLSSLLFTKGTYIVSTCSEVFLTMSLKHWNTWSCVKAHVGSTYWLYNPLWHLLACGHCVTNEAIASFVEFDQVTHVDGIKQADPRMHSRSINNARLCLA